MERIPEPELMDDLEQATAYANADFEEPHSRVTKLFESEFPEVEICGTILDLGCGPGDITFRFAYRFPESKIIGIDGSAAMIRLANERKKNESKVADRITFIEGRIQDNTAPHIPYDAIISNSLLHHLHRPEDLWETILKYAHPGSIIFIVDLFRPKSKEEAWRIVNKYSENEPEMLKRDFYNSLLSAFKPEEVMAQLNMVGLPELSIKVVSDRHIMVYGVKS